MSEVSVNKIWSIFVHLKNLNFYGRSFESPFLLTKFLKSSDPPNTLALLNPIKFNFFIP